MNKYNSHNEFDQSTDSLYEKFGGVYIREVEFKYVDSDIYRNYTPGISEGKGERAIEYNKNNAIKTEQELKDTIKKYDLKRDLKNKYLFFGKLKNKNISEIDNFSGGRYLESELFNNIFNLSKKSFYEENINSRNNDSIGNYFKELNQIIDLVNVLIREYGKKEVITKDGETKTKSFEEQVLDNYIENTKEETSKVLKIEETKEIKHLKFILDKVDYTDSDKTLKWIILFIKNRYEKNKIIDEIEANVVIQKFKSEGYESNVNIGKEFNKFDQDNHSRYIIGQILKNLISKEKSSLSSLIHIIKSLIIGYNQTFGNATNFNSIDFY